MRMNRVQCTIYLRIRAFTFCTTVFFKSTRSNTKTMRRITYRLLYKFPRLTRSLIIWNIVGVKGIFVGKIKR